VGYSDYFQKDFDWDAQGEIQNCKFGYVKDEMLPGGLNFPNSINGYCKSWTIYIKGMFDASRAQDVLDKVITRLKQVEGQ
jgi:hypothetical protein